jgi:2-polyprenyl-6-methoxyphenol hydroxylase-like FAD-dependent oxidoreductase
LDTLNGEEYLRCYYGGTDPSRSGEYIKASPCEQADLPQSILEPIMLRHATQNGFKLRWDCELISFTQDEQTGKVHSIVKDHVTGQDITVISNYLCGADGARSIVTRELQLPFDSKPGGGFALNVFFEADLGHLFTQSAGLIHFLLKPDKPQPDYCAATIARQVEAYSQWVFVMLAKPGVTSCTASEDEIIAHVKDLIGDPSVEVKLKRISSWTINESYAEQYSRGNVFCLGDAVHRHPPFNGLGSNTCIQDAYNLAWKIAYVQKGLASPSLLNSFSAERQPVGKRIVKRANDTGRIHAKLLSLLGVAEPDVREKRRLLDYFKDTGKTGAETRRSFQSLVEQLDSERQGFGVEMNQLYQSSAVYTDDEDAPPPKFEDPDHADLYYLESTYPGFRLPHAWLRSPKALPRDPMVSTHDLAGKGRFCVLSGFGSKEIWEKAAREVKQVLGVDVVVYSIGWDDDYRDILFDWARKRGVGETGAVLVRPDRFVAWRCFETPEDCGGKLVKVMSHVLGR